MSHSDKSTIYLLWDESHLWGFLLQRAMAGWGFKHRVVSAVQVAQGILQEKPPGALAVPGGWASRKLLALGQGGAQNIKNYLLSGGDYIGFCGGAGLALDSERGLDICPLKRMPMSERLPNFSGHIRVKPARNHPLVPGDLPQDPAVPVWWPSQFDSENTGKVEILAQYQAPGQGMWVADLSVEHLTDENIKTWQKNYNINLDPGSLTGQPCLIAGTCGQGRYVLSYTHLETPSSPAANAWLKHILSELSGQNPPVETTVPAWDLAGLKPAWYDETLARTGQAMAEIIRARQRKLLWFWREPWLLGWRRGMPGFHVNNLYCLICQTLALEPNDRAVAAWQKQAQDFDRVFQKFTAGLEVYLDREQERLARGASPSPMTGASENPDKQRLDLFGAFPGYGGLYEQLVAPLDRLALGLLAK